MFSYTTDHSKLAKTQGRSFENSWQPNATMKKAVGSLSIDVLGLFQSLGSRSFRRCQPLRCPPVQRSFGQTLFRRLKPQRRLQLPVATAALQHQRSYRTSTKSQRLQWHQWVTSQNPRRAPRVWQLLICRRETLEGPGSQWVTYQSIQQLHSELQQWWLCPLRCNGG